MHSITRKQIIKEYVEKCLEQYKDGEVDKCVICFNDRILTSKVKFPLLEYAANILFESLHKNDHIPFCDKIEMLKTIGGNVIIGIILQKRLSNNFIESIHKATEYIEKARIWYICDIIGERVFGFSLLNQPKKTIPEINRLSMHHTNWVIRSLGAGVHYAVKKGLDKSDVRTLFKILLSISNSKDKEIRQGVGWAAKTTAKFHPDIIEHYQNEIENTEQVANWFRRKVKIGLEKHEYAKRNRS